MLRVVIVVILIFHTFTKTSIRLAATLAYMNPADIATYGQLMMFGGSGAAAGYYISGKIGPTELPQAVAAFHSLVCIIVPAIDLAHPDVKKSV